MNYPLTSDSWGEKEIKALNEVVKSRQFTMSKKVRKFEEEFAKFFNCKDSVMVNSGSSANLLMFSLLKNKYKLKGDVIVPAVGWSTSYFPINQNGFKLNFVDVDLDTLNIDPEKIERAITSKTCAILAINLLGNSCDFIRLKRIAKKYKIILLEDNCESFGAKTEENFFTGTQSLLGTFSFFYSHHLQTMEGGMILSNNINDVHYLRSLRAHGWIRDLPDNNKIYSKTGNDFYDSFTFVTPGYCLRPLEISGAVGSVQLKRSSFFLEQRRKNASFFVEKFKHLETVQIQKEIGKSSWFGFSILLKNSLKNKRHLVIERLKKNGIQTRPIVTGNFLRNPVMKYLDYIDNKDYNSSEYIHKNGFFIGNNHKDLKKEINLVYNIIKKIS